MYISSFVPESIRWLRLHGQSDKAMEILRKAAKVNKRVLPDGIEFAPLMECKAQKSGCSWFSIFWPKKMLIKSFIQSYAW